MSRKTLEGLELLQRCTVSGYLHYEPRLFNLVWYKAAFLVGTGARASCAGLEDEEPGKAGDGERSGHGRDSLLGTVTEEDDFAAHAGRLSRGVRHDGEVAPALGLLVRRGVASGVFNWRESHAGR